MRKKRMFTVEKEIITIAHLFYKEIGGRKFH